MTAIKGKRKPQRNVLYLPTEVRVEVEKIAREKLLREQEKNLDEAVSAKGMTEEQAMFWREKILGIKQ